MCFNTGQTAVFLAAFETITEKANHNAFTVSMRVKWRMFVFPPPKEVIAEQGTKIVHINNAEKSDSSDHDLLQCHCKVHTSLRDFQKIMKP
jgi:predicted site-specific integrase-resolvase